MSNPPDPSATLYPHVLERIKEMTFENNHELAMWYAAHQLGLDLEPVLAAHVCMHHLEGELTPTLQQNSIHLRARLRNAMTATQRAAFDSVT